MNNIIFTFVYKLKSGYFNITFITLEYKLSNKVISFKLILCHILTSKEDVGTS